MPGSNEYMKVFGRFEFEVPPVAVKFLTSKPDGIERLEENMALCEMLKKAQEGQIFFVDGEKHTCGAGS